jgi:hypothetical protein
MNKNDLIYKKKYLKYKQKYIRLQKLLQYGGVKKLSNYIENISNIQDSFKLLLGNEITLEGVTINIPDYMQLREHPSEYAESIFQKVNELMTYYETIILNLEEITKAIINTHLSLNDIDIVIDVKIDKNINDIFDRQIKYIMTQINTILPASISNIVNHKLLDLIFASEKTSEEKCKVLIRLKTAIGDVIFNTFMNSQLSLNREKRKERLIQLGPFRFARHKKRGECDISSIIYEIFYKILEKNEKEDQIAKKELDEQKREERNILLNQLEEGLKKLCDINDIRKEKRKFSKERSEIKEELINLLREFNHYLFIFDGSYMRGQKLTLDKGAIVAKFNEYAKYLDNIFNDLKPEITKYVEKINKLYDDINAESMPTSGTPSSGTPSSGTPSSGTPSSGTPSSGTPSSGRASGSPLPNIGKEEKKKENKERRLTLTVPEPTNGRSSSPFARLQTLHGSMVSLTPSSGTPSLGTPSLGTPSLGTPSLGTPSLGTPSLGTPSLGTPSLGRASGSPLPNIGKEEKEEKKETRSTLTVPEPTNGRSSSPFARLQRLVGLSPKAEAEHRIYTRTDWIGTQSDDEDEELSDISRKASEANE